MLRQRLAHPLRRAAHQPALARLPSELPKREGPQRWFWTRSPPAQLLGIEGLEGPRDFPRMAAEAVEEARRSLSNLEDKTPLELVEAFDGASNGLCRIADAAELCRNVHPDQKFVQSADEAVSLVATYMSEVNLDLDMYLTMQKAESSELFASMPVEAQKVLGHMRESMEHEGIHLPDEQKAECIKLLEKEQMISFGVVQRQEQLRQSQSSTPSGTWVPLENVQDALGNQAQQMPRRREGSVDEVLIPKDPAWTDQILRHAKCPKVRRKVYESSRDMDMEGEENMVELLQVRQSLAGIRGYNSWNEYAQRESLLQSPDRVSSFLSTAWDRLKPGLSADLHKLAAEKERRGLGEPILEPWDVPMMLQACRQDQLRARDEAISEYLTYGSLMKGVELILERMLGLSFVAEQPGPGEVWHPSVQKYTIREGSRVWGTLYLDPFMRPGKAVQSAQFTLQGSKKLPTGDSQTSATCLVFNLPVGGHGLPVSYATTFMHEIGHALHSLLSDTYFQHLSGTRGAVDFVEFPSHLFEHFVIDASCLGSYASHVKSGGLMPAQLQETYRAESAQFAHVEAVQQLMYAAIDQAFYSCKPSGEGQVQQVHDHLAAELGRFDNDLEGPFNGQFSELLGLSRPSKFDHLVHYGGSYYCYLFNRALSAHVWKHGFHVDPFHQESGNRLREFFKAGSVVQKLGAIEALCPGAGGFSAEDVPLDAFVAQLSPVGGAATSGAALGGA